MTIRDRNVTVDHSKTNSSANMNKSKRYNWYNEEDVEFLESEMNDETENTDTTDDASELTADYFYHFDRKMF